MKFRVDLGVRDNGPFWSIFTLVNSLLHLHTMPFDFLVIVVPVGLHFSPMRVMQQHLSPVVCPALSPPYRYILLNQNRFQNLNLYENPIAKTIMLLIP